jgi:single-strand DNA-binding protein
VLIEKVIEPYVHKGSFVIIEGKLATRKWQDQQGIEKYSTEIVLDRFNGSLTLGPQASGGGGSGRDDQYSERQSSRYGSKQEGGSPNDSGPAQPMERRKPAPAASKYGDIDDDIPF